MKTVSISRIYNSLFRYDDWNIGIVHKPISTFLGRELMPRIEWLPSAGKGKYLADPFALRKNDTSYIFCEEFDYRTRKGRICCIEEMPDGSFSRPKVAIELSVHMSYPFLIDHKNEIYCVPETYRAREIALYRARNFPYKWEKFTTLVNDFAGVDPTVFQHDGMWWMACTNAEFGDSNRLFILYSSDLMGAWKSHLLNPVKVGLDSSRPAGTPFSYKGDLYRPAQDCSKTYGGRIVINKVLTLTRTHFEEEPVATIEPSPTGPYPNGIHTISSEGQMTLVDGKRVRFLTDAFKSEIREHLDRLQKKIRL